VSNVRNLLVIEKDRMEERRGEGKGLWGMEKHQKKQKKTKTKKPLWWCVREDGGKEEGKVENSLIATADEKSCLEGGNLGRER
jgi:hypothetical protein